MTKTDFTDKLIEDYLNERQIERITLPIYYGGSVAIYDNKEQAIYSVNLHDFAKWACKKKLNAEAADRIRKFIETKINDKTLYTPDYMLSYPLSKRFQLFVNSNIAEHVVETILGGTQLDANDMLTIPGKAVIGDDGCAEADVTVGGIGVEVKVTHNDETAENIFKSAHRKMVVAVYIISTSTKAHWHLYLRHGDGSYVHIPDNASTELGLKVLSWQTMLREKAGTIELLYFQDESNGGLTVTPMIQSQY